MNAHCRIRLSSIRIKHKPSWTRDARKKIAARIALHAALMADRWHPLRGAR
jgi:hypothetical protein